ncbi:hypothetical protein [Litorilituus lipolyticus]|uniref:Uncharacterized protein n=1 Tax=Litorilituus lipolyticus TaxID=2491017 RepID=A0A502KQ63_9GAMM|nr:hypothetical protein [Litorilituus lipolyticus]TPH12131.1 hypothetical protein EPA86_17405 [Litorilituus lipolyticus]
MKYLFAALLFISFFNRASDLKTFHFRGHEYKVSSTITKVPDLEVASFCLKLNSDGVNNWWLPNYHQLMKLVRTQVSGFDHLVTVDKGETYIYNENRRRIYSYTPKENEFSNVLCISSDTVTNPQLVKSRLLKRNEFILGTKFGGLGLGTKAPEILINNYKEIPKSIDSDIAKIIGTSLKSLKGEVLDDFSEYSNDLQEKYKQPNNSGYRIRLIKEYPLEDQWNLQELLATQDKDIYFFSAFKFYPNTLISDVSKAINDKFGKPDNMNTEKGTRFMYFVFEDLNYNYENVKRLKRSKNKNIPEAVAELKMYLNQEKNGAKLHITFNSNSISNKAKEKMEKEMRKELDKFIKDKRENIQKKKVIL